VIIIGLVLFFIFAPVQILRERAWQRQHGPNAPLSRELWWGRAIFGAMALTIVLSLILGT
jgi:hypothetical protein